LETNQKDIFVLSVETFEFQTGAVQASNKAVKVSSEVISGSLHGRMYQCKQLSIKATPAFRKVFGLAG